MNGANGITAPKGHEWDRMRGVQEGKFELVKALLERSADPNAKLQKTPTRYGFTVTKQSRDSTPLTLAAFAGEAEIMRLLKDHGADMSRKPKNGLTPLLFAAGVSRFPLGTRAENAVPEDDLLAAVKMAVELGADVNEAGPAGNTALHGAAWIRSTKIIQFLADNGADVNALNKKGQSPIYIAQRDGRTAGSGTKLEQSAVADLLRELGASDVAKKPIQEKKAKPVDPSGNWRWEHEEEGETVKNLLMLSFDARSNMVTGTYQGRVGPLDIKNGRMDGDKLMFTISGEFNDRKLTANYTVQPQGDKLIGKVAYDLGGETGELQVKGIRQQPRNKEKEGQ